MSNRYTLAEARAIINAERCVRDWNGPWCETHDAHWPDSDEGCKARPEVADVAAQLLATVEEHEAADRAEDRLFKGTDDEFRARAARTAALTPTIRAAINGEEVTE